MNIHTILHTTRPRSLTARVIFGLFLVVVMVAAFATAGSAENIDTPRAGVLHVTKECSQNTGLPGGFCTITGSNLNAIRPGMKVVYTNPAVVGNVLRSDLFVDGGDNNHANGHVDLNVDPNSWIPRYSGPLTFSGGTGSFRGFHAFVWVTCTLPAGTPCAWDGWYIFTR